MRVSGDLGCGIRFQGSEFQEIELQGSELQEMLDETTFQPSSTRSFSSEACAAQENEKEDKRGLRAETKCSSIITTFSHSISRPVDSKQH